MATLRQFNIGIYREHLEDGSFLYEQRLTRLDDPELRWLDLDDVEQRFEAHVDGLVIGGDLAHQICRVPGDPGETHTALCVFCREDLKTDALALLNALDPTDDHAVRAASLALRFEAGSGWREDLVRLLRADQTPLAPLLAQVAGFRRYSSEDLLATKLSANPAIGRADLAWALGRVGSRRSIPLLSSLLNSEDERTGEAAAMALLRLGDSSVIDRAMERVSISAWAQSALAIGGDSKAARLLLDRLNRRGPDEDTLYALGMLGDLAAVAPLLQLLEDDALAGAAAVALNTITGANLFADHFVPDTFDPDELFDEEREQYETQGTVLRLDGRPYGDWERAPLRDPGTWREWLEQNKHRFSRDRRWRLGEPHGPAALLASLRSPDSSYRVRAAASDELVVRYGLDVPFEVELRVRQQLRFLTKIESWVSANVSRFEAGRYYFAGQLQQ